MKKKSLYFSSLCVLCASVVRFFHLLLIFGKFQQVDATDSREKGGTGLDLAICRSISITNNRNAAMK